MVLICEASNFGYKEYSGILFTVKAESSMIVSEYEMKFGLQKEGHFLVHAVLQVVPNRVFMRSLC